MEKKNKRPLLMNSCIFIKPAYRFFFFTCFKLGNVLFCILYAFYSILCVRLHTFNAENSGFDWKISHIGTDTDTHYHTGDSLILSIRYFQHILFGTLFDVSIFLYTLHTLYTPICQVLMTAHFSSMTGVQIFICICGWFLPLSDFPMFYCVQK